MNKKSFYISKLIVTGGGYKDAIIDFAPGCNIVSGASNTGKTYIFRCIDFVLGADKKSIPDSSEAYGYTDVVLEIKTHQGDIFTLSRNLEQSTNVILVNSAYSDNYELVKENKKEILTTSSSSKTHQKLSDFLLSLSGYDSELKIRQNVLNKKRNLTFRYISHLFLIGEGKITRNESPVLGSQSIQHTSEIDVFKLVITGEDSSELDEIPDKSEMKSKLEANRDMVSKMIQEQSNEISNLSKKLNKDEDTSIEKDIKKINDRYLDIEKSLAVKRNQRESTWKFMERFRAELIDLDSLDTRFDILLRQYEIDLERLDFLSKGGELFSQLNSENPACPICGSTEHKPEEVDSSYLESIDAEIGKIKNNITGLVETIKENTRRRIQLGNLLKNSEEKLDILEKEIKENIQPIRESLKQSLDNLGKRQNELLAINSARNQMGFLREKQTQIIEEIGNLSKEKGSAPLIRGEYLADFAAEIKKVLVSWSFISENSSVDFDQQVKVMDISIDGKLRSANGKGVRALLHSAFTIGLLKFCDKNGLPHPGIVILDTPMRNFEEGDETKEIGQKSVKKIVNDFFVNVSEISTNSQIIIFENDTPPVSVQEKIKYHYFSNKPGVERQGFIPEDKEKTVKDI